jgi:DNA-binding response OmpR family regulator
VEPQFVDCGIIGSYRILRNDLRRTFQVNEQTIKLTLSEYLVMVELIERERVDTLKLMRIVYSGEDVAPNEEAFHKFLNRLRKKIRTGGLVIRRITGYGYLLDSEEGPEMPLK